MARLDEIDMKILAELIKDAKQPVPKLSRKIRVSPSLVYSRIKRLLKRNLIRRFTIIVNEEQLGYNVAAIIGINIDSRERERIINEILSLERVREVYEVTGRFDLIVEVKAKNLEELHQLVSGSLGKIEGVQHTETFMEMKRTEREPSYKLPETR